MANEILKIVIDEVCSLKDGLPGGRHHMDKDCVFIRPTGNPLTMSEWDEMMGSSDVNMTHNKLVSINKLEVEGNLAYACYTSHSKFNYKGIENDDISVFTAIFKRKLVELIKDDTGNKSDKNTSEEKVSVVEEVVNTEAVEDTSKENDNTDTETPKEAVSLVQRPEKDNYHSNYRGVRWENDAWFTHMYIKNEKTILGPFNREEEAAKAYDKLSIEMRPGSRKLNFPDIGFEWRWLMIHGQRSTGRKPDEPVPFS